MRYFLFLIISFLFSLNSYTVFAEDSLTVKQQLDRIVEEVRDLNKAVFNKSFNNNEIDQNTKKNDTEKFTSIDIRIYDLEKDIKNLTLQFEEILFELDDISNQMNVLERELIAELKILKINSETKITIKENEEKIIKEKNTLGNLVISDKNKLESNQNLQNLSVNKEIADTKQKEIDKYIDLSPEEQLQYALNQIVKKKYDNSKNVLENFIIKFPDNQLSGSAHFWLGKIYLFELDYRKAAIIFGEGIQKFPKSIKAAEMYYELSKSLKEMDKNLEACKTLSLLEENYKGNKFTKDPDKIKVSLNCNS